MPVRSADHTHVSCFLNSWWSCFPRLELGTVQLYQHLFRLQRHLAQFVRNSKTFPTSFVWLICQIDQSGVAQPSLVSGCCQRWTGTWTTACVHCITSALCWHSTQPRWSPTVLSLRSWLEYANALLHDTSGINLTSTSCKWHRTHCPVLTAPRSYADN